MTPHPATARPKVVVRSPEWYGWSPDLPERAMEGTIDEDSGAQIRDGIKSVRLTRDLRQGYFTMPFAYLLDADLSDDFWTIRLVQ